MMQLAARIGAWCGENLPYDAEVEFLESTGTQWIDTLILADSNKKAEFDIQAVANGSRFNAFYYGVYPSWLNRMFGVAYGNPTSNRYLQVNWGSSYGAIDYSENIVANRHKYTIGPELLVDGVQLASASANSFSSMLSVTLFAENTGRDILANKSRCFGFRISENDVVLCDFFPVRFTNENGVSEGAMYDRVSGRLFRNAGTGAFVIGPDKAGTDVAGGYKWLRHWRSASRRARHFSRWEVAA